MHKNKHAKLTFAWEAKQSAGDSENSLFHLMRFSVKSLVLNSSSKILRGCKIPCTIFFTSFCRCSWNGLPTSVKRNDLHIT